MTTQAISARELQKSIADLHTVSPWPGLLRALIHVVSVGIFGALAWNSASTAGFLLWTFFTALAYGTMMITTHDAIHHTFTGLAWFDELFPRLISFPVFWFHGLYSEIHKLHHKMNGTDVNDPERVQWTQEEYDSAGTVRKWYARNQILIRMFVFGGFGMMFDTIQHAMRFYKKSKGIRLQFWIDCALVFGVNGLILLVLSQYNLALKYIIFYILIERITGVIMQFRAQIEHYGLWGKHSHYFETQLMNCRNIGTNSFVSWYFNHLNFHSVHHAFPTVPFYNLEKAHYRLKRVVEDSDRNLVESKSYLVTMAKLIANPVFIQTQPQSN